ncbi:hypothetical protein GMA8713_04134 [Grimontia marina]|uniref:Uncharacterized protein n=1 Tax=Grimontia marina TaxID=646534 RepID=A0A128FIK0_9GAMM|nr:hypothetical protein GMA8713_04134 [Grimontia marina]
MREPSGMGYTQKVNHLVRYTQFRATQLILRLIL